MRAKKPVVVCGCGRRYLGWEFAVLELVGTLNVEDEYELEMRTCECGSTISVPRSIGHILGTNRYRPTS